MPRRTNRARPRERHWVHSDPVRVYDDTPPTTDLLAQADADLAALARLLPALRAAAAPGRWRHWDAPTPPEELARHDQLVRTERDELEAHQHRVRPVAGRPGRALPLPPMGRPGAPVAIAAVDALAHVEVCLVDAYEAAADRLALTPPRVNSTRRRITGLRRAIPALTAHPDLAEHLAAEAARLHRAALAAVEPAPVLYVGHCPHCAKPSLRVDLDAGSIACGNPACRCPADDDCGCRRGRRHRWPRETWGTLADMIRGAS